MTHLPECQSLVLLSQKVLLKLVLGPVACLRWLCAAVEMLHRAARCIAAAGWPGSDLIKSRPNPSQIHDAKLR